MRKLVLAAALLASASTAAMADDPWVMNSNHTCRIPQYSLADTFRMFSQYSASVGFPQPQVDYNSGAAAGATFIRYTDPNTGHPGMIAFFANRALCEAGRARIDAWIAAGKPAL